MFYTMPKEKKKNLKTSLSSMKKPTSLVSGTKNTSTLFSATKYMTLKLRQEVGSIKSSVEH